MTLPSFESPNDFDLTPSKTHVHDKCEALPCSVQTHPRTTTRLEPVARMAFVPYVNNRLPPHSTSASPCVEQQQVDFAGDSDSRKLEQDDHSSAPPQSILHRDADSTAAGDSDAEQWSPTETPSTAFTPFCEGKDRGESSFWPPASSYAPQSNENTSNKGENAAGGPLHLLPPSPTSLLVLSSRDEYVDSMFQEICDGDSAKIVSRVVRCGSDFMQFCREEEAALPGSGMMPVLPALVPSGRHARGSDQHAEGAHGSAAGELRSACKDEAQPPPLLASSLRTDGGSSFREWEARQRLFSYDRLGVGTVRASGEISGTYKIKPRSRTGKRASSSMSTSCTSKNKIAAISLACPAAEADITPPMTRSQEQELYFNWSPASSAPAALPAAGKHGRSASPPAGASPSSSCSPPWSSPAGGETETPAVPLPGTTRRGEVGVGLGSPCPLLERVVESGESDEVEDVEPPVPTGSRNVRSSAGEAVLRVGGTHTTAKVNNKPLLLPVECCRSVITSVESFRGSEYCINGARTCLDGFRFVPPTLPPTVSCRRLPRQRSREDTSPRTKDHLDEKESAAREGCVRRCSAVGSLFSCGGRGSITPRNRRCVVTGPLRAEGGAQDNIATKQVEATTVLRSSSPPPSIFRTSSDHEDTNMLPRDHSYSYEEFLELQSAPSLARQRASNEVNCDLLVDPVEGWRYGNGTDSSSCGSVSGETDCEESGGEGDCEESGGWEEKSEFFVGEEPQQVYCAFQSRRSSSLPREQSGGGRERRTKGPAATNDVRDRDKSNGNAMNNATEEDESSAELRFPGSPSTSIKLAAHHAVDGNCDGYGGDAEDAIVAMACSTPTCCNNSGRRGRKQPERKLTSRTGSPELLVVPGAVVRAALETETTGDTQFDAASERSALSPVRRDCLFYSAGRGEGSGSPSDHADRRSPATKLKRDLAGGDDRRRKPEPHKKKKKKRVLLVCDVEDQYHFPGCSEGELEKAQQSAKMNTSVDKSWVKRTKSTTASWSTWGCGLNHHRRSWAKWNDGDEEEVAHGSEAARGRGDKAANSPTSGSAPPKFFEQEEYLSWSDTEKDERSARRTLKELLDVESTLEGRGEGRARGSDMGAGSEDR